MASGRVLCNGQFKGSCVALTTSIVVTAAHVVEGAAPDSVRLEFADGDVAVQEIRQAGTLDIVTLGVREGAVAGEPIGRAVEGDPWWVDSRPEDNDPILTGRVNAVARKIVTDRGEVEVLQLTVDQNLAEHFGYSGSAVRIGLPGDPGGVTGILIEQVRQRTAGFDDTPPSSNVLYAVPIEQVIRQFRLAGLATSPPRQFRVPKPPIGVIERASMLEDVVRLLIGSLPDKPAADVIIRAPGGMGKTVLSQQVAHSAEVWRAFPGGVFWVQAGPGARTEAILSQLESLRQTGSAVRPTLVMIDDVWSGPLLLDVRAQLPEPVRLLSTTRGVVVDGMASYPLTEMGIDDSIAILSRSSEHSPELDAALRRLAEALGRWPLLLDMASRQLHLADIDLHQSLDISAGSSAAGNAELLARAERLRAEFVGQPTSLDDPESTTRSLRQMVRRSLDALPGDDDRRGYDDLAVFPAGARLSGPMLADLWQLDTTSAERRIVRLYRVGLITVQGTPITIAMHDLLVAELHERRGDPGSPPLQPLHDRCAAACVAPGGRPSDLTNGRAEWLAYHLMRGTDPCAAEVILAGGWRSAYRVATGSDASYLQGLRRIIAEFGSRSGRSIHALEIMLRAFLRHGLVKSRVASSPTAALVAYALLGAPEAALREAAEKTDPAAVLGTIVTSLHRHGRLSPEVLDLAWQTAEAMTPLSTRAEALTAIASVLKDTDPTRAIALAWRAEDYATAISREELDREDSQRDLRMFPASRILGWQRVPIVELIAPHDPDGAARIAESLVGEPARCTALAQVAAAVAPRDTTKAEGLVTQALSIASANSFAIASIAVTIADVFPTRAAELASKASAAARATSTTDGMDSGSRQYYLGQKIAPVFPEVAADLAESMTEDNYGALTVLCVVDPLALRDPGRAIRMAEALTDDSSRSRAQAAVVNSICKTDREQAMAVAERITDPEWAARALIDLAAAVTAEDRERGLHLARRAVAVAQEVHDTQDKGYALAYIARTYGSADPDQASAAADLISSSAARGAALADIAVQHAPARPDVARAILRHYEEEQAISWTEGELYSLIQIGAAAAACDLPGALAVIDSALALAETLPRDYEQSQVRSSVLDALAHLTPDRVLNMISAIPEVMERYNQFEQFIREVGKSDPRKAADLAAMAPTYFDQRMLSYATSTLRTVVAVAMAAVDPREARRILTLINDWTRDPTVADVAVRIAGRHPREALALADSISGTDLQVLTLARLAAVLMPGHRRLAISVMERAENAMDDMFRSSERDEVRAELAGAYADVDVEHALFLVQAIGDSYGRYKGIEKVVAKLAAHDVARARQIATTMLTGREQARALAAIALALIETRPLLAEEIAINIDDYMLLAEILRQKRDDPEQANRISELIRQRLTSKGMGYAPDEGELLGVTWPLAPCTDAPSSVFLRNGSDLKSVLDVTSGLLKKWAGSPPVTLVNQVIELLLSEAKAGSLHQAAPPGTPSAETSQG